MSKIHSNKGISRGFMNMEWDGGDYAFQSEIWAELLRVLKPGGYLLAFAHVRTNHKLATAIEKGGFNIKDQYLWIHGGSMPHSRDIGKDVEKINKEKYNYSTQNEWEDWGTSVKTAYEPIVVAQKPISEKSIAKNTLKWRVGALNIGISKILDSNNLSCKVCKKENSRWPSNISLDEEAAKELNNQAGSNKNGGVSKYFYCSKPSLKEKEKGLEDFEPRPLSSTSGGSRSYNARCKSCGKKFIGSPKYICKCDNPITDNQAYKIKNNHPTVKPIDLLARFIKLHARPGAVIFDPFMGSSSIGVAALLNGYNFIGIEIDEYYFKIGVARCQDAYKDSLKNQK